MQGDKMGKMLRVHCEDLMVKVFYLEPYELQRE